MEELVEHQWKLLRSRFEGRRVVLLFHIVQGARDHLAPLQRLGTQKPFMLASIEGAGALPERDELDWVLVDAAPGANFVEDFREYQRCLCRLSASAREALERYDPDRKAILLRSFVVDLAEVAGRPVYGAKHPSWVALEDKVAIDAFWDRHGVPRAPSRIVELEPAALAAAHAALDCGEGTVWAGDARDGWYGGALYMRWVREADEGERARSSLARRSDRVRIMPFLEGMPCSIHGIVFPDTVIALRPVEQVVFRRPDHGDFLYAGCATWWDPPEAEREAMRALARHVGEALRDEVGFRGTFTIDGVLGEEGFLPTELNPRFGAGISVMARALPDVPVYLMDQAICAGEDWDFRPVELERLLLDAADGQRGGGAWARRPASRADGDDALEVLFESDGECREAKEGERADGRVAIGPSAHGCLIRFTPSEGSVPIGTSVAPWAARVFRWSDERFGTDFGRLESLGLR